MREIQAPFGLLTFLRTVPLVQRALYLHWDSYLRERQCFRGSGQIVESRSEAAMVAHSNHFRLTIDDAVTWSPVDARFLKDYQC